MPLLAQDANASSIQVLRHGSTETVAYSATAGSTSALTKGVYRIVSSSDSHFTLLGTATTSDVYLPAGAVEFVRVVDDDVISFVQNAAAGTAFVTEML